jgi:mono/diheme cytochrome c family protein
VTRNEIILGLVALVLVVFSLIVSLFVPRRNPGFPGRSLRPFVFVAIALVAGMLATVEVVGGEDEHGAEAAEVEGGGQEETPEPGDPASPGPGEGETGAAPADTGQAPAETGAAPAEPSGDPEAGAEIFASAGCASCHTLEAAGSTGTIGPNLDESQPSFELAVERVTNGRPPMPAFRDQLSEEEINNVAAYVVQSTTG